MAWLAYGHSIAREGGGAFDVPSTVSGFGYGADAGTDTDADTDSDAGGVG
jgi:hypothetical protein